MFSKVYEFIKKFIKENFKFLLVLLFIFVIFKIELPYKIYKPGGMVSLNKRVIVENGYSSSGELGMAYVSVMNGNIPFLLISHLIPNWDIYADDMITYDNESWEQTLKKDQISMKQSIDTAIFNAYKFAGKEIKVTKEEVHVTYIDEQAKTDISLFDILLSVDGKAIHNLDDLKKIIEGHQSGDLILAKVLRNDKEEDVSATVFETEDGPKIGIGITTTYDYETNPKINLEPKASESGASGGLMMTLAIYNALVEEDITKGKKIIGTGTIDMDGNVGEIDGVKYKILGAVKKKCDIFLVPKGDYEEALKVKNENNLAINVVAVSTLQEAIDYLKKQ